MTDDGIRLATMIDQLREELMESMALGHGQPLQFECGEVTLEAQVTARRDVKGKTGLRFWIAEAGGEGTTGSSRVQTVKLTLKPLVAAGDPDKPQRRPLLSGKPEPRS